MRQRLFWAAIMLVLFLLAMGSCSEATHNPSPTTPPPTPSPTPTETTSLPKVDHQPEIKLAAIDEIPCCPRWSPDGQKIAFAIGLGNYKGIYVVNRDGRNLKRLVYIRRAEGDSPPIMPTWTDDSQHVLYRDVDGVFIVPADGSSDPQPYDQPAPLVPEPAWPPDYQPPSPETKYNSQLSPDGQYLAVVTGFNVPKSEQGLYLRRQATAKPTRLPNVQTYTDPLLNFSLRYPASWTLEARDGTNRNDGSGRAVFLEREDYLLEIEAQFRPESPGECSGRFDQDKHTPADYRHYQADGVALWRAKVEEGQPGGYNDDTLTFITIISPTDSEGVVGRYTCALEIEGKIFAIDYRLPHSLSEIETGQHRADILAEMDEILQSIIWDVDGGSPQPTPTPLGYDATPTTTTVPLPQPTGTPTPLMPVPPTPTPDEISQIKAARTI